MQRKDTEQHRITESRRNKSYQLEFQKNQRWQLSPIHPIAFASLPLRGFDNAYNVTPREI
jgi:hypothetical protein